jgi:hypothetical protein
MADLTELESSQTVKIVGSDSLGEELSPVKSTNSGDLNVSDQIRSGGVEAGITVTTTSIELKVGGSRLTNRKLVTALPSGTIYWGYNSTVTASTGTPIFNNQLYAWAANDTCEIWLITTGANKNVRITEAP